MEIVAPKSCPYGHTDADLRVILGERYGDFKYWMRGQTMTLCDGRSWVTEDRSYHPNACADNPHGPVVYGSDLRQFLNGGRPLD